MHSNFQTTLLVFLVSKGKVWPVVSLVQQQVKSGGTILIHASSNMEKTDVSTFKLFFFF